MSVILALPDELIEKGKDPFLPWTTNKIGGIPNWMNVSPSCHPRCKVCQSLLLLIVQIYCPLEGSQYHRTLHVFGCIFVGCSGKALSYVVLRSQEIEKVTKMNVAVVDSRWQTESWGCNDADDWGMEEQRDVSSQTKFTASDLCSVLETDCNISNQPLQTNTFCQRKSSDNISELPQFDSRYIFAVSRSIEMLRQREDLSHERTLLAMYEEQEGISVESLTQRNFTSTEKYEESKSIHGDVKFERFQKVISMCPQQCLRYSCNLDILPYSDKTEPSNNLNDIPQCHLCNSPRRLELQLLPSLPWLLKLTTDKDSLNNLIDFGCLFIFTCKSSCWSNDNASPIEEFIVYQADPDSILLDDLKF